MENLERFYIDINSDVGESFGNFKVGNDAQLMPHLSSCNIACGFHGGDPYTIEKTIDLAIENGVKIGAHPSYPDLQGFGRRQMDIPIPELISILKYQIGALLSIVKSKGASLSHVKPHGALYNAAAQNKDISNAIIESIRAFGQEIPLMGLAGSVMQDSAELNNMPFISEAFADRRYNSHGKLLSRKIEGSVITDPKVAKLQVLEIVLNQRVQTHKGGFYTIDAKSICIHGDNPEALEIARAIDEGLGENNITKTGVQV